MDALSTQVISSVVPADNFSGFAPLQPQVSHSLALNYKHHFKVYTNILVDAVN